MNKLEKLKIGEWTVTNDELQPWTVKTGEDSYYSSESQDAIIMMSLCIQANLKLDKIIEKER